MKMLRLLGLMVFVVFIAAFASGCGGGGGGGGGSTDTTPPATTPPEPTPDPEPDDSQRISTARGSIAGILANARTRAQTAQSVAGQIRSSADATAEQITRADTHSNAAQRALTNIETASRQGIAATTAAQAETALADARREYGNLDASASALATIQGAVQQAANRRRQQAADETAQTGGSSLIKHIRDNRKVYDTLLPLTDASIPTTNIGAATDANKATYPYHKSGDGTVYPKPADVDRGVLGVTITVAATPVPSNSKTGRIKDPGRLSQGFDLKDDNRHFANAYTDIKVSNRVRDIENGELVENTADTPADERYVYQDDPDYLLAGIWLDDSGTTPSIQAFAYGNQPISSSSNFCTAGDVTDSNSLDRSCSDTTGLNLISTVLDADTDETYTYRGNANGAYLADGKASFFKADVSLTAEFQNAGGTGSGTIGGNVTKITAGGKSIDGSIELQEQDLSDDLTTVFANGKAAGVVEGNAYNGAWKGQFFGMRKGKRVVAPKVEVENGPDTQAISYEPGLPGSVAGTFYVNKLSGPGGDAAFIGAFGTHR